MDENKSSISQARSYREIGEFWDTHDVTDYWEQTEAVEFEVNLESDVRLVALESDLATQANELAWKKTFPWKRSSIRGYMKNLMRICNRLPDSISI